MDDATVEYSRCSEAGSAEGSAAGSADDSADAAEAAALAEKIEKIRDLAERKRRTAFEFREQRKRRLAELRAEADACAASGVEMDQDRAAELDKILWAKHKQAEQTKENKIINEIKYKVTRKVSYEEHREEILERAKRRREEEAQLLRRSDAAGRSAWKFEVRAGCRLECNPGHCAACALAWNEGRHPVHARIRAAYEVQAQDELPMPVDAQEDAAFLHGLQRLWCRHDCSDYLVTRVKCKFHGECQRCTAVKRREQEQASAKNHFYEPHREDVRLSKERVRIKWRSWMDSWNSDRSEANGVRWRQDFERQLAEATARRG